MEAWMVFQRYSNPWGADSASILKLCEAYEVSDPLETMEKILTILEELDKENG
jgi:hypothetical protein